MDWVFFSLVFRVSEVEVGGVTFFSVWVGIGVEVVVVVAVVALVAVVAVVAVEIILCRGGVVVLVVLGGVSSSESGFLAMSLV